MPDDVAQLSDRDLDAAVAEEVLNWKPVCRCDNPELKDMNVEHGELKHEPCSGYYPSRYASNWSAAGEVVEAMRERGYRYSIIRTSDKDLFVSFDAGWNEDITRLSRTNCETRAICEAALAAKRAENNGLDPQPTK